MTAREAIDSFRESYPSSVGEDVICRWLSDVEGIVTEEIVLTHAGAPERAKNFSGITLPEAGRYELTAKGHHAKLYFDYLRMRCDEHFSDTARYEVSSSLFAASYDQFADSYNRAAAPAARAKSLTV